MNCERYAPYLSGYVAGELRADTARIVAAHLEGCRRCRTDLEQQQAVVANLRTLGSVTVVAPFGLAEDILAEVHGHAKLGSIAAAVPLAVADRARRLATHPNVRGAAAQVAGAGRQVAERLTDPKARAAAAAGAAAVAGGIIALATRRRRVARGTAPA